MGHSRKIKRQKAKIKRQKCYLGLGPVAMGAPGVWVHWEKEPSNIARPARSTSVQQRRPGCGRPAGQPGGRDEHVGARGGEVQQEEGKKLNRDKLKLIPRRTDRKSVV